MGEVSAGFIEEVAMHLHLATLHSQSVWYMQDPCLRNSVFLSAYSNTTTETEKRNWLCTRLVEEDAEGEGGLSGSHMTNQA